MSDPITTDPAMRIAQQALEGLALQQEVIGHNLANVDTPAYHSQAVDFQSALRRALDKSDTLQLTTTNVAHQLTTARPDRVQIFDRRGGSLRADGNNVDVDVELSQMAETGISYQAITQLISKKFLLLRSIVSGR